MEAIDRIALQRLMKPAEAEALLGYFAALIPGANLALIRADGMLFAGAGPWRNEEISVWPGERAEVELATRLTQAESGQIIEGDGFTLCPLQVNLQSVGGLLAWGPVSRNSLAALRESLAMFLTQAYEKRAIARETLDRYREINLLYHIGETIGACLDPVEIPQLVLKDTQDVIPASIRMVLLPGEVEKDAWEIRACAGIPGTVEALLHASQELISQVSDRGRPDIQVFPPEGATSLSMALCAPLKAREQVLGLILLGRQEGQPLFTASDEKLLMALASQAGIALEKAWLHLQEIQRQRLEEELAIGQRIQLSLLPATTPVHSGWEFAAVYQAARQVGGDFYDFIDLPKDAQDAEVCRLGMVIADVTGKGVPAALMMAFTRAIIRTTSLSEPSPAAVLERLNQMLVQDNRSQLFLTAFYIALDLHSGRLTFANGGHDQPLWIQASTGECQELKARSFLLGAFENISLEERQLVIASGDLLVFYTDGVTEARSANNEFFGEERLQAIVLENRAASPDQIAQAILQSLHGFVGDAAQSDDITLVIIKRSET